MQLNHEFTVPAPVDEVWRAMLDPERVAPCMPGATLTEVSGETFTGKVKVKLGPISLQYAGSGEFVDTDPVAHQLVIKAAGKDTRGAGTASTTSTVTLTESNGVTRGAVVSDVKVTGRPAQFGRGLIAEVAGRLLTEFAGNLATELAPQSGAGGGAEGTEERAEGSKAEDRDAVDLMQVAGVPVLKRVLPVLAVLAVVAVAIAVVRVLRRP